MSAEYLLDGIVLDNGKLAFNKPDYLNAIAIGKIGVGNIFEVVLRKKVAKAKPNLFKYYFGPLIDTVMATNEFAGRIKRAPKNCMTSKNLRRRIL
jgi:hypothetical protein